MKQSDALYKELCRIYDRSNIYQQMFLDECGNAEGMSEEDAVRYYSQLIKRCASIIEKQP